MELLLLSNSTLPGKARLEHALPLIAEQLQGRRSAVFIPFAGVTQTGMITQRKRLRFSLRWVYLSPVFIALSIPLPRLKMLRS